ncbi:MAG: tetratricopeptide repeat protein [Verrucomicrobia bacterium]|nr:tetratricopeptide repeat protein [Verrucomicrobiota bacterium]
MTRWFLILTMTLSLLRLAEVSPARAQASANDVIAAGIVEFSAAYGEWDGNRFAAAAELFRAASTQAPASSDAWYWLGAARFHRLLHLRGLPPTAANTGAAEAALESALTALEEAAKLDDRNAEVHALLGTLYGMQIGDHLIRALRYGPRVQKHRRLALAYGAENPRVRYLLGVCHFHTAKKPDGLREALVSLLEAERQFAAEAQEPGGRLAPRWGRSSCLTFLGRTYERLGQPAEAADYFRRALVAHPADYLAREGLIRVAGTH